MPENLTNLDQVLKDYYTKFMTDQVATFSAFQEKFEKMSGDDVDWDGRVAREGVVLAYSEAVGAIGEYGNLPKAGNWTPGQYQIPMRYQYARVELTEQIIESASTSRGAFANAMRMTFDTIIKQLKRERARSLAGDGNGILALVNGTSNTTTTTIDSPGGVAGNFGAGRFLRPGMIIAAINPAGPSIRSVTTVLTVAANGLTFTTGANFNVVDNDPLVRVSDTTSNNMLDTAYQKEPSGILSLIDNGTFANVYHGLNRTTFPILQSYVETAVGALSLDVIQKVLDILDQQGDGVVDFFASHHAVRRTYLALLEADRRYTGGDLRAPDGGTKAAKRGAYVTYANKPFIEDKYLPYDMLFAVDPSEFRRFVQKEGEWAQRDGAILSRVANKDAWEAFYRIWEEYHNGKPNSSGRLEGITTTKVYVASR